MTPEARAPDIIRIKNALLIGVFYKLAPRTFTVYLFKIFDSRIENIKTFSENESKHSLPGSRYMPIAICSIFLEP